MKDTEEKKKEPQEKTPEKEQEKKINVQALGNVLLMIIVVLIIGNAVLIYYMMNMTDYEPEDTNTQTAENEQVDTLANIINTVVTNTTGNNTTNTTVNAVDASSRKVMNENIVVLYDGLILDTSEMKRVELQYIDNTSTDKDKYVITYYNYENFSYKDSSLGTISDLVYDNLVCIENVGKVAISESYSAINGNIKVINTLPTVILDNNTNLSKEYDTTKTILADLDSNGADEYITILANKTTGYSKISLFDSTGKAVADLAYIEKAKWNQNTNIEYYLSLDNVNIIDVDNDGIMEILVEIPKYEGESSVSLLKYKNSTLEGETNIECSLLP